MRQKNQAILETPILNIPGKIENRQKMVVTIVVSLITLIAGVLIGFVIANRSRNNLNIQFDVKSADLTKAAAVPNKEEVLVMQQITITSLISVLGNKDLDELEKQYVLKAIEVAEIIPGV